jgi:hypothetical protein
MARDFQETTGVQGRLFTDPSRATYAAMGAKSGALRLLDPRVLLAGARSFREGHGQTAVKGDPFQLGGELVVRAGGAVAFVHHSAFAGDHADVEPVLRALVGGAAAG